MNKRILSLVLVLAMVLGTFSFALADEEAPEAPATNPKVDWLVKQGLVKGDAGTGDLRTADPIKRSEVAAMVVRAMDKDDLAESVKDVVTFSDVLTSAGDKWANGHINVAYSEGIVNGYPDGTFKPGKNITKAEAVSMMVRVLGGLTEDEAKLATGRNWATIYLTKAKDLGILDGIVLGNTNEAATREFVFEMVYNTLTKNEVGKYNIYKAIVLENNRVESLGKNEIMVEVIRLVQKANYTTESRDVKGDQLTFELPEGVKDSEELLGKVVDIYVDRNDKLVDAKIDNSYDYVQGDVTVLKDNKFGINWRNYTTVLDERYEAKDDRVFRSYLNNKPYSYKEFAKKDMDFARATIKNGKVLFIDAFKFDDIAPVKEVKKDGAEVYVYNDARDGGTKRIDLKASTRVLTVKDGILNKGTIEDIAANDVIHEYAGGYIVRKDAKVDGTYNKVTYTKASEDDEDDEVCVVVDDGEYGVSTATSKKPVYSYDSKDFYTLETRGIDKTLRDFKDEKVTVLLDVSDNLQFITSEIELGEFVAAIDNIIGKEARVLKGDKNDKAEYVATFDSELYAEGTTRYQNLKDYNYGDIVYLSVDDDNIDTMLTLIPEDENGKEILRTDDGNEITSSLIKFTGEKYRILDRTNVFVRTKDELRSTSIDYVLDNYKLGKDDVVKAIVLTDEEYEYKLDHEEIDYRHNTSGNEEVAHTIVFTNIARKSAKYNHEIVEVLDKHASGRDYVLEVKFSNGEKAERTIVRTSIGSVRVGDIVDLSVTKDDDKNVRDIEILIPVDTKDVYKVVEIGTRTGYRKVVLEDKEEVKREYWIYGEEFGSVARGDKVSIYDKKNADMELEAVIVRDEDETLGYWGTEPEEVTTGVVTYISGTAIEVDNKTIYTVDSRTILKDAEGKTIGLGLEIIGKLVKGDIIEVKDNVITRTVSKVEEDAKAKEEADKKAAADVVALIEALPAEITLEAEEDVVAARKVYDALTEDQKAFVTNLDALEAAEDKIKELEDEGEPEDEVTWEETPSVPLGLRMQGQLNIPEGMEDVVVKVNGTEVTLEADGSFVVAIEELEIGYNTVTVEVDGEEVASLAEEVMYLGF